MRCRKKLPSAYRDEQGNPVWVDAIWEVAVNPNWAKEIRSLARQRRVTMSWIVRYCLFCLILDKKKYSRDRLKSLAKKIKNKMKDYGSCQNKETKARKSLHRLYVCFYGGDEEKVKITALELGVSVSMLIRLAIYKYLPRFKTKEGVSGWQLFWDGIKIYRDVKYSGKMWCKAYVQDILNLRLFSLEEYWKIPKNQLPPPRILYPPPMELSA